MATPKERLEADVYYELKEHAPQHGWRGMGYKCICGLVFVTSDAHLMHQSEKIIERIVDKRPR